MIINKKKLDGGYEGESLHHVAKRQITFYDEAPTETIGIFEFQSVAVSRLQVLKKVQFLYDSNSENRHELMAKEIN